MSRNHVLQLALAGLFATGAAWANAQEASIASGVDDDVTQIKVNCNNNPRALKNALDRKNGDKLRFVIAGECLGPLKIDRDGIEIVGDVRQQASLKVTQSNAAPAAILLQSAAARFANFNIDVPAGMAAIKAQANATATIDDIETNAVSDWGVPLAQFVATDSSSLLLTRLRNAEVLVVGASSADFGVGNTAAKLDVRDTSAAKSSGSGNTFAQVQASANGYFLADNKARITALGIWGKAAVEVTRESEVGKIDMGGQTLFAAYLNSSVTGPYGLYGNVVFELEHSRATNWSKPNNPHSMFIGNNATVDGVFFPDWSWAGQGKADQP